MRIVVFAPSHPDSAIGRSSRLVNDALVEQGHETVLIATESAPSNGDGMHGEQPSGIHWTEMARVSEHVAQADFVVYHIGDNFGFHEGALAWLAMKPGVVCLHDFFLGNLFNGWSLHRRNEATTILQRLYGEVASASFFGHRSMQEFVGATYDAAPMTEWVCEKATGVVTHSGWGTARVLDSCGGPVSVLPLAYEGPSRPATVRKSPGSVGVPLNLLTLGNANWNKRIDSVIRAIGSEPQLQSGFAYRLVGAIDDAVAAEYRALAHDLGVTLEISGPVTDVELATALHQADVVSCLRRPTLEAASASAIEAMLCGKPTMVTDAGFYAELPDDCVVKIDPLDEVPAIAQALKRLMSEPKSAKQTGANAKAWATKTFTADAYASGLVDVGRATLRSQPATRALNRMVGFLADWGCANDPRVIEEMLSPLGVFEGDGPFASVRMGGRS